MRAAQRRARYLRQPHAANQPLAHQFAQGPYAVFNRHPLVPAVQVIQVDHISLQPPQAVLAGLAQRGRVAVNDAHQFAVAVDVDTLHAALAGQGDVVALRLQDLANQGFVGAKAIQRRRVKQGHTAFQCRAQHTLALLAGHRRTVSVAQVHAAQTQCRHLKRTQFTFLHIDSLRNALV